MSFLPPLWKHQKRVLTENKNHILCLHGLGSGKTRTACCWAQLRFPATALVVCPKGLKENWRRECEKWGLKKYRIISKEEFKRDAEMLSHRVLILDEADYFYSANFKSALSKVARKYIKKHNPNLMMLTGTIYRSSPWNIFTAATLLGYNWNYYEFKQRFFYEVQMGFRTVPMVRAGIEGEIRALIEKISDVFRVEDDFDIPDQIDETIFVEETKEQVKLHEGNVEIQPIVRFTRDHQIEAGIGLGEGKRGDDGKMEVILEYASKTPKIAIVARYRAQLERYAERLRGEGYSVFEIHGDVVDRSGVLDKVEKAEKCVLLITAATCEGWEAPSIGLVIFASMGYSYRDMVQLKGRFLRMNHLKKNIYIYLIAGETDKAIMSAMNNKKDMDILDYYKSKDKK